MTIQIKAIMAIKKKQGHYRPIFMFQVHHSLIKYHGFKQGNKSINDI